MLNLIVCYFIASFSNEEVYLARYSHAYKLIKKMEYHGNI